MGRPLVLLAVEDGEVSARFAYQLTASGFNVVTDAATDLHHARLPDVIVARFAASRPSGGFSIADALDERHLRGIPVVAIADDVGDSTRDLARQEGCAAVCLTTCSGAALAAGIRAVLGRR